MKYQKNLNFSDKTKKLEFICSLILSLILLLLGISFFSNRVLADERKNLEKQVELNKAVQDKQTKKSTKNTDLFQRKIKAVDNKGENVLKLHKKSLGQAQIDKEKETDQTNDKVKLNVVHKDNFIHPGITVSPDKLENTRKKVIQHIDPWYSYYDAMRKSPYAQQDISSVSFKNLLKGTIDTPKDTTFSSNGHLNNLSSDGFGAYTQALMYYFTGNPVYRCNSMRLIRIWEKMDPTQYQHFADDHIHVGTPFYYMVSAAELNRYTIASENNYEEYSLVWTDEDTDKLTNNFIEPIVNTFLHTNTKYFNQHLYPLVGAMSGYIFTNNEKAYNEAVEWFTVNKTRSINKDTNGAISNLFHEIKNDYPENPTHSTYIQHLEMGRDQAHGAGDVMNLTALARMIYEQGTMIDPLSGEVSEKNNAVDPYQYLNYRLLRGAEQFYHYMAGYTIPWTQLGLGDYGGPIPSEAYRGRTGQYFNLSEIYDAYRYLEGLSNDELLQVAPSITAAAHNLNSPIYYKGAIKENFWGAWHDSKMTEVGCEYWLSIPSARKEDSSLDIPAMTPTYSDVSFSKRGTLLDQNTSLINEENGIKYFHVNAVKDRESIKETGYDNKFPKDTTTKRGNYQISLSSLVRPDDTQNPYLGLHIRTNGVAKLEIGADNYGGAPYQVIYLPDTHNQWTYVAYNDSIEEKNKNSKRLDNMDFYRVISPNKDTYVDFDKLTYLNTEYGQKLTALQFKQITEEINTVKGVKQSFDLKNDLNFTSNVNYSINYSNCNNSELSLDKNNGILTFNFDKSGSFIIFVTAQGLNDTVSTQKIVVDVSNSKKEALDKVLNSYDSQKEYTFEDQKAVEEQINKTKTAKTDEDFVENLLNLQKIIKNLKLLNPTLNDGSLNYVDIVSSAQGIAKSVLSNLVDNDAQSFSGDVKSPIILDFGYNFALTTSRFEVRARQGFPNRSQGTNVYGSNDGKMWTLLTDKSTTNTSELETIQVKPEQQNNLYRFLKLQVDYPGRPNDPNYPGIASYSEFRIFGKRHEFENALSAVSIKGDGLKNRVMKGQNIYLTFSAKEKIDNVSATIDGTPVKVVETSTNNYLAQFTLPEVVHVKPIEFTIDYTIDGKQAVTQRMTTDGTNLYESTNQNELDLNKYLPSPNSSAYKVRQSSDGDVSVWFDNKIDQMFEARKDNAKPYQGNQNVYKDGYVTFDFSDKPIAIDHLEMIARQDKYSSRATNFMLRATNDDPTVWSNWVTITANGQNSTDWQILTVDPKYINKTFKYVQMYGHAEFLGLTELKIFGNTVAHGKILYQDENGNEIDTVDSNLPSKYEELNNSNVDIKDAPNIKGYTFKKVLFGGKQLESNYFRVVDGENLVYVYIKNSDGK